MEYPGGKLRLGTEVKEARVARRGRRAATDKVKVLKSTMVYEGSVFGVRRDEVIEPGGLRAAREVVTHSGSVVVLPVLPDGRIVLVRQYRYATRQFLWELVAGRMDEGETVREAARRELREETGYQATKMRIFLDIYPSPGFLEERMYVLLAEGLTAGEAEPEEDERITSRAYRPAELKRMLKQAKFRDAKTIAGILYYLTFLR